MDLMLRDGDLLPGADGQPLTVTGLAELRQRVMIRLCSRRSGFVPYPELGSELYRMNRADQEAHPGGGGGGALSADRGDRAECGTGAGGIGPGSAGGTGSGRRK